MDVLPEMPRIVRRFGLTVEELPRFTTMCHAKERLYKLNRGQLLALSGQMHNLCDVRVIDASGFYRIAASRKHVSRTNYTSKAMKTTVLVDRESSTILDVHASTYRPHDAKLARHVLSRNFNRLGVLTADKDYDPTAPQRFLQAYDVDQVIKFRRYGRVDYARNRL